MPYFADNMIDNSDEHFGNHGSVTDASHLNDFSTVANLSKPKYSHVKAKLK